MYLMFMRFIIYDLSHPPIFFFFFFFFLNGIDQKSLAGFPGIKDEILSDFFRRAEVMRVYRECLALAAHCWCSAVLEMMGV